MTSKAPIMQNILVTGGEYTDREDYALKLAQYFLCLNPLSDRGCNSCINCQRISSKTHPNLVLIEPPMADVGDNSSQNHGNTDHRGVIKIDQVRRIITENQKANFEKGTSIFIITHMNKITKAAANALLKVMEENLESKMFIALSPSRMTVLPTIASRLICHLIKPTAIHSVINEEIEKKMMMISKTKPVARFSLCGQFSCERDELLRELDELTTTCHTLLRQGLIFPRFAKALSESLEKAQKSLRKNLNPRLVAEILVMREWPYINA